MAETIVLDPSAVATSRTAIDITSFISSEGVDWGDAAITQYLADGQMGAGPIDYTLPNRQVVVPLKLMARGTVTFETIRRQLQAKVALLQREQGWLSRSTAGGTVFADVVNATLKLGGDWLQATRSADVNASLSLELRPDWYGAEVTLDDITETSATELVSVLKLSAADAVISGDYPARVRILVDEDDAEFQLGLVWGVRSRYYDSAATAAVRYEAEVLTPLDTAAATAITGASGGTVVRHTALRTDWTGVLSTQILSGGAHLTHRGTNRVRARVYSTSTTPPRVRLVWNVGDVVSPEENTPVRIAGASNFYNVDLGEVRLDAAPVGTHRWQGEIQAIGDDGGENVSIDKIQIVNVDEGYGVLTAPQIRRSPSSYSQTDSFTSTTAGTALNGRVAPLGGTWATSGDANDFLFDDDFGGEQVSRTTGSGTNGRYAVLGATTFTDVQVEASIQLSHSPNTVGQSTDMGVIARWTDASNYLRASSIRTYTGGSPLFTKTLEIRQVVAGIQTVIAAATVPQSVITSTWYGLRLVVYANGQVFAELLDSTKTTVHATASGASSVLATGGALASGKNGLFDRATDTETQFRNYDDFRAGAAPTLDAVLYPSQSAELRTDGMYREDVAGAAYAKVIPVGDLPRLPVSGLEGRKVELFVKASRGDFDQLPDSGIDDISARVTYRPCWVFIS